MILPIQSIRGCLEGWGYKEGDRFQTCHSGDETSKSIQMMKSKGINKQPHKLKATPATKVERPWWILGVFIVLVIVSVVLRPDKDASQSIDSSTATPVPAETPVTVNIDLLVGRWVRTDNNGDTPLKLKARLPMANLMQTTSIRIPLMW